MASRQYILAGANQPIFLNETGSLDYIAPVVYVNETSSTPPASTTVDMLPLMGVSSKHG